MGKKLRRPLLIEAVCEFRFRSEEEWDWAVPGMLYERIRKDFSERHQVQGMSVQLHQTGTEPVAAIHLDETFVDSLNPDFYQTLRMPNE